MTAVAAAISAAVSDRSCMTHHRTVYRIDSDSSAEAWTVSEENGEFRGEFPTKQEAVEFAKEQARPQESSQIEIHTTDGNVEYEST